VFVPLCGKSVDMAYLASNSKVSHVVGIDIIKQAAEDFAHGHPTLSLMEFHPGNEDPEIACDFKSNGSIFHGDGISIIVDDLFYLLHMHNEERAKYINRGSTVSPNNDSTFYLFDSIYDRASMIAIDPSLRNEYATHMGELLTPGGVMLLVTLERRKVSNDGSSTTL
jgi:thiopurine S-methyltransferase